jgi:thiamine-phosphate pyrophosphorylase
MIDYDPQFDERLPADSSSADRLAALRIIDANFNRATEGLRVVEEHCRFALNDQHLTDLCKRLRHELTAAISTISAEKRYAARETQVDVGTAVTTSTERSRKSLAQIAAANWQRALQALRAIEEYGKLLAPDMAQHIEALRYRAYTLAKACTTTAASQERLADARLYVLLDGRSSECDFVLRAEQLIAAGVHALQLRDKRLDDRTLLARARLLRRVIDDHTKPRPVVGVPIDWPGASSPTLNPEPRTPNPLLIVNDRPDIAVLARADERNEILGRHLQAQLAEHHARGPADERLRIQQHAVYVEDDAKR